ncbi:MAG: hypothetical protein WDN00_18100 [Limisphaerales bacterium]
MQPFGKTEPAEVKSQANYPKNAGHTSQNGGRFCLSSSRKTASHLVILSKMDDHNDSGAKAKITKSVMHNNVPIAIKTNPPTTINSAPLIKRRWVKFVINLAVITAILSFIATIIEVPNSVMNWFINTKTLSNSGAVNNAWHPPELPQGCKIAYVSFGGVFSKINLDDLTSGKPFIFPEMPTGPVTIYLKNNRLYVHSDVCSGYGSDSIDSVVKAAKDNVTMNPDTLDGINPAQYDRNYSESAFEVVSPEGVPVFQVIYQHPNYISVNGIFLCAPTNGLPLPKDNPVLKLWNGKSMAAMCSFETNCFLIPLNSAADYRHAILPFKELALFKYPSFKYKGEYANQ